MTRRQTYAHTVGVPDDVWDHFGSPSRIRDVLWRAMYEEKAARSAAAPGLPPDVKRPVERITPAWPAGE